MADSAFPVWRFGRLWDGGKRRSSLAFRATLEWRIAPSQGGVLGNPGTENSASPAFSAACGAESASAEPLSSMASRCASVWWAMRVSLRGGIPCDQRSSMRPVAASRVRALRRLFAPRHRRCPETLIGRSNQPSAWGVSRKSDCSAIARTDMHRCDRYRPAATLPLIVASGRKNATGRPSRRRSRALSHCQAGSGSPRWMARSRPSSSRLTL